MTHFYQFVLLIMSLIFSMNNAFAHDGHGINGPFHGLFHQWGDTEYSSTFLLFTTVISVIFFFVFIKKHHKK